jgi:hypothetical protein
MQSRLLVNKWQWDRRQNVMTSWEAKQKLGPRIFNADFRHCLVIFITSTVLAFLRFDQLIHSSIICSEGPVASTSHIHNMFCWNLCRYYLAIFFLFNQVATVKGAPPQKFCVHSHVPLRLYFHTSDIPRSTQFKFYVKYTNPKHPVTFIQLHFTHGRTGSGRLVSPLWNL